MYYNRKPRQYSLVARDSIGTPMASSPGMIYLWPRDSSRFFTFEPSASLGPLSFVAKVAFTPNPNRYDL